METSIKILPLNRIAINTPDPLMKIRSIVNSPAMELVPEKIESMKHFSINPGYKDIYGVIKVFKKSSGKLMGEIHITDRSVSYLSKVSSHQISFDFNPGDAKIWAQNTFSNQQFESFLTGEKLATLIDEITDRTHESYLHKLDSIIASFRQTKN